MATPADMRLLGYTFRDDKGQTSTTRFRIGGATPAAVETAYLSGQTNLQALSNAHVSQATLAGKDNAYGTNAIYESVEDKLQVSYQDENGQLHRFRIPAPKATIFLSDGETLDPANADVVTFNAWVTGNVYGFRTATDGLVFVGGIRTRSKMKRKFNIWTLNPALTGPGE